MLKKQLQITDNNNSNSNNLDEIETKIHQLLKIRDKIKTNKLESDEDEDEINRSFVSKIKKTKQTKPTSILKASSSDSKLNKDEQENNSTEYNLKQSNELINLMKNQLESYKQNQDSNLKLINELRQAIEVLKEEKQSVLNEKENLNEKLKIITLELENSKKSNQIAKTDSDQNIQTEKEKLKETLEQAKKLIKKHYQTETEKLIHSNEVFNKQQQDKIDSLEKNIHSLEDEFRSALIIESNRYNELFLKYEMSLKETNDMKSNYLTLEMSDERNKSLIKELNELIKEQKNRLQILAKMRTQTTGDLQKRDEKLTEAVSDCTKLKQQCELLKKTKTLLETKIKTIVTEYNAINNLAKWQYFGGKYNTIITILFDYIHFVNSLSYLAY